MTDPVVVVARPTTSGKSALALALGERFDGVVVNVDSMQLGSVPCSRLRSGGCPRRAPERELMALQAKARATRSGHDHGFGAIEINIGLGLEMAPLAETAVGVGHFILQRFLHPKQYKSESSSGLIEQL